MDATQKLINPGFPLPAKDKQGEEEEKEKGISWNLLRAALFDCPDKENEAPFLFEKAYERILQYIDSEHPFIVSINLPLS
jgi:hypothetical protein